MSRLCAIVAIVVSACHQSSPEAAADAAPELTCKAPQPSQSIVDACMELATARCERLQVCSPTRMQLRWPDIATCETREQLGCMLELTADGTGATMASLLSCAAAISLQECDAFLSEMNPPTDCLPSAGIHGDGEACRFSSQCASSFCGRDGSCHREPAIGEACAGIGCGPTAACVYKLGSSERVCKLPVGNGEKCVESGAEIAVCAYGLWCGVLESYHQGFCGPQGATLGASCRFSWEPGCNWDLGLTCNAGSCVELPIASAGQPCALINNVMTLCAAGASCSSRTCVGLAADCAECDPESCQFPARCEPTPTAATDSHCVFP